MSTDPIVSQSNLLPHSFYVDGGEAESGYQLYLRLSGRSTIEAAEKVPPEVWNRLPLPSLPMLSYDDFFKFLTEARDWFTSFAVKTESDTNMLLREQQHKVVMGMLDVWHQALVEQAETNRVREEKDRQLPTFFEQLLVTEMARARVAGPEGVAETQQRFAGLVALASGGIKGVTETWSAVGVSAVPSEAHKIAEMNLNFVATLSSMRASIMIPMIVHQFGEQLSPEMAQSYGYASTLVRELYSTSFYQSVSSQLLAIDKEYTPEQIERIVAAMRITLLVGSLAAMYKSETGGLTSLEVADMLLGKLDLKPDSVEAAVAELIRSELSLFDPEVEAELLENIFAYLDSNPSVEELTDSSRVFNGILETSTNLHNLAQPE